MSKMSPQTNDPLYSPSSPENGEDSAGVIQWVRELVKGRSDTSLRDALEEYIEEAKGQDSVDSHEKMLIGNILKLRGMSVTDVMIPRADIAAIPLDTTQEGLLSLLCERQFSRLPVYRENLDEIVGTIHIKDILGVLATGNEIAVKDLIRPVPIVSPSMPVLDLLLMMKQQRRHMALVVDEYGGIDGLVTTGDVIEAIVGEIEDEYDTYEQPHMSENKDGSVTADARVDIDEFEEKYGKILEDEEREDIDTLGGLVFAIAGRIPARGEILTHKSGMEFEISEADPRRIQRIIIRNIPLHPQGDSA